ncbi:MAG TPA: redoxin domain-containing protein [Caldilineae bacterium]|nr:redoxin domain-containing protein [Caldilineae bacterium]
MAIILGLLVGAAFIYFYAFQDGGTSSSTEASRSEPGASSQESGDQALAVLLAADGVPIASARGVDNKGAQPAVGSPAPNFKMQLPDGETVTLNDLKGHPMIINFWATWCPPCRREMPDLIKAYEAHKDEGLVVLEVNSAEAPVQVEAFIKEFGVTAPVVIDARNEVLGVYRTNGLPASFFIDKDGVIQAHWPGFLDANTLNQLLAEIL